MTSDQMRQVREIFEACVGETSQEDRQSLLVRRCAGDSQLEAAVRRLLEAREANDGFLETPLAHHLESEEGHLEMPTRGDSTDDYQNFSVGEPCRMVGPYKIREQIGEGGFGLVYVAEQERPICRKVALKVIKPGMDTRQVIARFEAERQALALLDHPHIAKIFDAGTTDQGRPYFVMELVPGISITQFCDQVRMTVPERIHLFIDVCSAVQHAHQKGIIHRDLKPSNVLVTMRDDRPVVKVIDFGVAKAINQRLTEKSIYTSFGQMIGTPMYMSPEQAQMNELDVDTRSDVYSLGVLLYELLTGSTPFDLETVKRAGLNQLRQMICALEPPRPSSRISTLASETAKTLADRRQLDQRRLRDDLHGELDWIVMKTLEKDRSRRYETVNGLAADLQRYLTDEPVLACPPSTSYRLQKFARKHNRVLGTLVLVILTMLGGIIATSRQAVIAGKEAQRANLAEQQALDAQSDAERKAGEALEAAKKEAQQRKLAEQATVRESAERSRAERALPRRYPTGFHRCRTRVAQ